MIDDAIRLAELLYKRNPSFVHVHDPGHERMQSAEVVEIAFAGERVLEVVVCIHGLEAKLLSVADLVRFRRGWSR
jgi:hypothetical protein